MLMGLIRCILIPRWSLKGSLNQPIPRWSVLEWPTRLIYTDAHASTWSLFAVRTRPSLCIEYVHWWKCFLSWRLHSDQQINCFCLKACLNSMPCRKADPVIHAIPSCRWNLNELRKEGKKKFSFPFFLLIWRHNVVSPSLIEAVKRRAWDGSLNHLQIGSLEENKYVSCSPGLC